jgi:alkylation response protein AidB-like acyl-CoA dehydrogenase
MSAIAKEQSDIRELAARVAVEIYAPLAAEIDTARRPLTLEERLQLADLGFLGISHPQKYGGSDAPLTHALSVIEELAKECRPAAFQVFEANTGPAQVINLLGTEEQRERWLPDIVGGRKTMAIAISEPEAGSASTDMRSRATPTTNGWILSGAKRWISNAGEAEQYLVYARLNDDRGARGVGAFVVEKDFPGVSFGSPEKLMGFRGVPSADIYFDEVFIPTENLVVPAGGFSRLFSVFSIERLGNATVSLALGQAAVDRTIRYVQQREQFGKHLIEFQGVQLALADMVMQVEAARLLIMRAAAPVHGGNLPDPFEVSVAKCTSNEMAKRVTDLAMQLHGGNGYTEEYGLERLHRDAHGWAIAGGTPNMQRIRLVSELLGRKFDQRR